MFIRKVAISNRWNDLPTSCNYIWRVKPSWTSAICLVNVITGRQCQYQLPGHCVAVYGPRPDQFLQVIGGNYFHNLSPFLATFWECFTFAGIIARFLMKWLWTNLAHVNYISVTHLTLQLHDYRHVVWLTITISKLFPTLFLTRVVNRSKPFILK